MNEREHDAFAAKRRAAAKTAAILGALALAVYLGFVLSQF